MVSNLAKKLEDNHSPVKHGELKEQPVKWCTVSLSEILDRDKRLEASVFDVDARKTKELIAKSRYDLVSIGGVDGLTASFTGARFKRIWLKISDLPIYQPSSITDIKPSPDGYISHLTNTDIDGLRVKTGQILLTCSGTIGKATIVTKTLNNLIFSHDLLRINCKNENDVGYIYCYLLSKEGQQILQTNSYGAVITHIESEHLANVPIPNPPDKIKAKIHNLIMKSYALRDESNELLDEANRLLKDELHLPEIHELDLATLNSETKLQTYSVKLSELKGRFDASYHVPIVDAIVNHLSQYAEELVEISDERISKDIILPGRFKRVYVEEGQGRVFIGGKQLFELNPLNKKYLSLSKHGDRISQQLELMENMVLITCSGTIGKVTLVPKHWNNWTANQHIIRVVPANDDIAGYLSAFLSTPYGHTLITRFTYGSVVDEIDDSHVSKIKIPLLKNKKIQNDINTLVLNANEKRNKAYLLEQEALSILEKEVIYA